MLNYLDDHISTDKMYANVYARHCELLYRLALLNYVEAFERFLKNLAAACIDLLAPYLQDDRYREFAADAGLVIAHFYEGTPGKALTESDTWFRFDKINDAFRQLLKDPFLNDPWQDFLFPGPKHPPQDQREFTTSLAILWQIRHTIAHNTGSITIADSRKLSLLSGEKVSHGVQLSPNFDDLRFVKRFLTELGDATNERIAKRIETISTQLHQQSPALFSAKQVADEISRLFQTVLTVNTVVGQIA
jgi:hypothetical protein